MKDDIRFKHAIMEYDHEIQFCKMVLDSDAPDDSKKDAKKRLEEAQKNKKKLLESHK